MRNNVYIMLVLLIGGFAGVFNGVGCGTDDAEVAPAESRDVGQADFRRAPPLADVDSDTATADSDQSDTTQDGTLDTGNPDDLGLDDLDSTDAVEPDTNIADTGQDEAPDVCGTLVLCEGNEPRAYCDGADVLVSCARNVDDCLVQTNTACDCVDVDGVAQCDVPTTEGGDTCVDAPLIGVGAHSFNNTNFENDYTLYRGDCGTRNGSGPDVVFRIELPSMTETTIVATSPTDDLILVVSSLCPEIEASCLARTDGGSSGEPETLLAINTSDSPVIIFVVVDSWNLLGDPGPFTVTISTE